MCQTTSPDDPYIFYAHNIHVNKLSAAKSAPPPDDQPLSELDMKVILLIVIGDKFTFLSANQLLQMHFSHDIN